MLEIETIVFIAKLAAVVIVVAWYMVLVEVTVEDGE